MTYYVDRTRENVSGYHGKLEGPKYQQKKGQWVCVLLMSPEVKWDRKHATVEVILYTLSHSSHSKGPLDFWDIALSKWFASVKLNIPFSPEARSCMV